VVLGTYAVGSFLPGWGIDVFLKGDSLFNEAARRQQALYIWIGTLVIVLIVLAAAVSTQAIHRQIRLNRLKNDFIATVTHELKTPLASMRVLVDTLIEGRTKDQGQAREYLELIAKENVRLTGLIDNFLTFSRMERNKQAFVLAPTDPELLVRDAVAALRTKFDRAECRFNVNVQEGLPRVLADHDGMVTVLVNLLDNACKYSGDRKEISLRAWAEDRAVCFSVSDNGVGIPRRALRRIFEKFYQVDQTLSRKAGGCGLGLAIVKFILDAHRGTIAVDSKVGQGSTFTVRLGAAAKGRSS
jgi:signal transduction histidine kinase